MADLYALAQRFRGELLRRERAAAGEMVRAYGAAWQRIQGDLARLTAQIDGARARGETVNAFWLARQDRLAALQRQAEAQLRGFASFAEARILQEQATAVAAAQEHAAQLVLFSLPPDAGIAANLTRLPAEAFRHLVGFLQGGSPLRSLFDALPGNAGQAVRSALLGGVATGRGPREIAREIRASLGGDLTRALTISRTETLRAYREASREVYHANRDVVRGWRWLSARTARTCAACLAMDGQVFDTETPLGTHPACRCVLVPVVDGEPEVEAASVWFARQPEATQREVLGPGKLELYQAGEITLRDLVHTEHSEQWGTVRREASLESVRAKIERRQAA